MMNKIKIQLSKPHLPNIDEYKESLDRIWKTHWITNFGFYAQRMEQIASNHLRRKNVAVVSSCDLGLIIALSRLNLKEGDEVILSPFTFNSTANAILWNHLTPVFADIDLKTWCINPEDVKNKITEKTKIVLGTHVFGNPCDANALRRILKNKNITLMFDAAQAYGAVYKNKKVGALGDIEVFSFSGTKTVISAEGGLIVTKDKSLIEQIKLIRNYGFSYDYNSQVLGINGKISEFNAALGCLSMKNVNKSLKVRNKIAAYYKKNLENIGDITFQEVPDGNVSTFKDFCILTDHRERLSRYLSKYGIETRNYFFPLNKTDYFKNYYTKLKNVDFVTKRNICIPIFNDITKSELDFVISKIKYFYKHEAKQK